MAALDRDPERQQVAFVQRRVVEPRVEHHAARFLRVERHNA